MPAIGDEKPNYFKKGVEYHNKDNFEKAIEMYSLALESYGVDKKTLVLLGNSYYMSREFERAEKSYWEALSLDPNYSKAYFNLGIIYEEIGKFKRAIESYKKTIELDSGFSDAYANLGDIYRIQEEFEKAILNYNKSLSLDRTNETAVEGLGQIPQSLIKKVTDRQIIKKSDELVRDGISEQNSGDFLGAKKKYEEALKLNPKSASAFFLLKLLSIPSVTPVVKKEAISFLDIDGQTISEGMSPAVVQFLGNKLGRIKLDQKTLEGFFEGFRKYIRGLKSDKVDILKASKEILFEDPGKKLSQALEIDLSEENDEANKAYETLLSRAPYLVHGHYLYGLFLELNDEELKAFKIYEKVSVETLDYVDENVLKNIQELFSRRPGYEYMQEMDLISLLKEFQEKSREGEAVSFLRFVRYKLSLEAEAKIKYGFEKEELGESGEAITAYEDAINIDPGNPISHYVLGLAYESRGLEKEALAAYEKTQGADYRGIESSEDISRIMEQYLEKTTRDGHRVGSILGRYFEIIAEDPEQMLELLGFIEDLKIDSISKIIKSHISTDMILEAHGKVVRDKKDFGGGLTDMGKGHGDGKVVRDTLDFGSDIDKESEKIEKARSISKISFELLWKYKTQRSIRNQSFSGDGKMLLAGSENGIVYFIDETAKSPWRYESGANIVDIDISSEGGYGLFSNSNNRLVMLDCLKGETFWEKEMGKTRINSVALSKDAGLVSFSTNNFKVVLLDKEGIEKKTYKMNEIIRFLDISDDGSLLLMASEKKVYIQEDGSKPKKLISLPKNNSIQSISISRNKKFISLGTSEGDVNLYFLNGQLLWKNDTPNPIYGISVSDEGSVVAGSMNGTITLYSKEGECLWIYQTGENIWDVDISRDGNKISSGCGLVFGNVYLFKLI